MNRNSHPYDLVPENVRQAVETIHNFIYLNGLGGPKGEEYWSYQGFGNVHPLLKKIEQQKKSRLGYRKHIRMLQKELSDKKETDKKMFIMRKAMMGAHCCYSRDPVKALDELLRDRQRLLWQSYQTDCKTCKEILSLFSATTNHELGTITLSPTLEELPAEVAGIIKKHQQITNQQNNKQ